MSAIEQRGEDGSYCRIDLGLAYNYWKLNQNKQDSTKSVQHEVVGKKYLHNNKVVEITKVVKHWFAGYYYMAIYVDENNSHGTVFIENINSIADVIMDAVAKFKIDFVENC